MDDLIESLFLKYWHGDHVLSSIKNMREQLHKNLSNQLDGFWSGHSAYQIMTKGGFLIDGKRAKQKELTELGNKFMREFNSP